MIVVDEFKTCLSFKSESKVILKPFVPKVL